jgi:hypothetical protein
MTAGLETPTAPAMQPAVTSTARIWLAEDGIAHWQTLPGTEETLGTIREGTAALWQISGRRAAPLLVDLGGARSISKEARTFLEGAEAAEIVAAVALLVSSPVSRMIGNFMIHINRPQRPLQLFGTEGKALTWLKGYLD